MRVKWGHPYTTTNQCSLQLILIQRHNGGLKIKRRTKYSFTKKLNGEGFWKLPKVENDLFYMW